MRTSDAVDLIVLAALWGASFLFMRVAAPEFGPLALIEVRVAVAALFLLGVCAWRRASLPLTRHAGPLLLVGIFNTALPFSLFAYALLSVTAGFASILNATSPLWGAVVAHFWLRERLTMLRVLGLLIGFLGVSMLVWGKASFAPGGSGWAIVAALVASLSYGVAASYTRRALTGVDALTVATGSQLGAVLALAPLALWTWPSTPVSATAWVGTVALGVACTGMAYILYFRLIGNVGAARAIAVTFLVPLFAIAWGGLFLAEPITSQMVLGGLVVLGGTALSTGLIGARAARRGVTPTRST